MFSNKLFTSIATVAVSLFLATISFASLPQVGDAYLGTGYGAGYGLHGHFINDDDYLDLITTCDYDAVNNGGLSWFNDPSDVGTFGMDQTIVDGKVALFGEMVEDEPWDLAVASNSSLELYVITDEELDPVQSIYDESIDYLYWGHVDGDDYMDIVAASDANENKVYIYDGNSNHRLDDPEEFSCETGDNPEQVALIRMEDFWNNDNEWALVIATGQYIKIYANDGDGSFDVNDLTELDCGNTVLDFAIGDIDGDGLHDIVACTEGSYVKTFVRNQNGSFNTTAHQSQSFGSQPYNEVQQVALGHYNYDGCPDLATWIGGIGGYIYVNEADETGDFDFSAAAHSMYITEGTGGAEPGELMFADLEGNSAYSIVMTGVQPAWYYQYGLFVWFNDGGPYLQPINNVAFTLNQSSNPVIMWEESIEYNIDRYTIYRALMESDTTKPTINDFDSLATVSHPTTSYTDSTVEIHSQQDNYYIWYAITARDDGSTESAFLKYAKAWGYYSAGDVCETIFFNQPDQFKMSAAPNPFNPTTTLRYEMPTDAHVTLKVFDVAGREVATLMDAHREAGTHNLSWDAGNLPSGVYFAQIQAGDYSSVQKLMLVK